MDDVIGCRVQLQPHMAGIPEREAVLLAINADRAVLIDDSGRIFMFPMTAGVIQVLDYRSST